MKSNSDQIFTVLGIALVLLLLVGLYMVVAGPDDVPTTTTTSVNDGTPAGARTPAETSATPAPVVAGGFTLSQAQVDALVALGINPEAVPDSISAEQELCFIEALGDARVAEIKAGAVPNAVEFMEAQACI